jgi:cytidine deaminase
MVTALGKEAKIQEGWLIGAMLSDKNDNSTCTPCGKCRQKIASFVDQNIKINLLTLDKNIIASPTIRELLPSDFSYKNIGKGIVGNSAELNIEEQAINNRVCRYGKLKESEIFNWFKDLKPDSRATDKYNVVIIKLENNIYIAGVEVQNAAYTGSTMAIQNAISIMNIEFGNNQKVIEVYSLTKNLAASKLPDEKDYFYPLSGTELEVLKPFATRKIKACLFNENGNFMYQDLEYNTEVIKPKKGPERFINDYMKRERSLSI